MSLLQKLVLVLKGEDIPFQQPQQIGRRDHQIVKNDARSTVYKDLRISDLCVTETGRGITSAACRVQKCAINAICRKKETFCAPIC